jgi:hypothetical protein
MGPKRNLRKNDNSQFINGIGFYENYTMLCAATAARNGHTISGMTFGGGLHDLDRLSRKPRFDVVFAEAEASS